MPETKKTVNASILDSFVDLFEEIKNTTGFEKLCVHAFSDLSKEIRELQKRALESARTTIEVGK